MGVWGVRIALIAAMLVFGDRLGFAQDQPKDAGKDAQKEAQPEAAQPQPKEAPPKDAHVLPTLRVRMPEQKPKRTPPKQVAPVVAAPERLYVNISPLPGGEIDREKVPSNVQTISASDLDNAKSPSLLDSMVRSLPGVSLSDQSGNAFQRNLDYRGFTASPVPGAVQGLAVYQNGTRINEAFGDVVNWDLIPEMAIARITLMPNNPLFGLNAIGGALSIDMKNGFNYHGTQAEIRGGSYGRVAERQPLGLRCRRHHLRRRLARLLLILPDPSHVCRCRRARRPSRIPRLVHRRRQHAGCHRSHAG
jgi:TonB-dependent Receptor Plug Domain